MNKQEANNSISVASRRTGLSQHVIRVWERRYAAVTPYRTESNRRLYTESDIARLMLLQEAIRLGHSIGQIANLTEKALQELIQQSSASKSEILGIASSDSTPSPAPPGKTFVPATCLKQCKKAVVGMHGGKLEAALMRAHRGLSLPALIEQILTPLMLWAGESWKEGSLRIAHEHFLSNAVRHFLTNLRNAYTPQSSAPAIVLSTPPGCLHELGAMMASILAAAEGWQDIYFGPNLPIEELANTVEVTKARALGLSFIYPHHAPNLQAEMTALARHIDPKVPILIGGQAAQAHQDLLMRLGLIVIQDIHEYRELLTEIEQGRIGARPEV